MKCKQCRHYFLPDYPYRPHYKMDFVHCNLGKHNDVEVESGEMAGHYGYSYEAVCCHDEYGKLPDRFAPLETMEAKPEQPTTNKAM